jgi:hypothetical protein
MSTVAGTMLLARTLRIGILMAWDKSGVQPQAL